MDKPATQGGGIIYDDRQHQRINPWDRPRLEDKRSLQGLMLMTADGIEEKVQQSFIKLLKGAPSVRNTFFPKEQSTDAPVHAKFIDDVACALVSAAISQSAYYNFSGTIDFEKAQTLWLDKLSSHATHEIGQSLLISLLGTHCRDDQYSLSDYIHKTPKVWAALLADALTAPAYLNAEALKAVSGGKDWLFHMHLSLHKLYLLDAKRVDEVAAVWKDAFQKQPNISERTHINHLPIGIFNNELFIPEVNQAIGVRTLESQFHTANHGTQPGIHRYTYAFGKAVATFVEEKSKPLELTTGKRPDNIVVDR